MAVPCNLIEMLKMCVSGFDREQEQVGIASMLWATLHPRRRHRKHRHASSFSRGDLRRIFGSDERFREINRYPGARYFMVSPSKYSGQQDDDGYTNGYIPTVPMQDALGEFLLS